jgi:hypothetical protein
MTTRAKTKLKTPARPRAAKQAVAETPTAKAFLERLCASATEAERTKYERYFPIAGRRAMPSRKFPPAERTHYLGLKDGS